MSEEVAPSQHVQKGRMVLVKVRPFTSHAIMTIPYHEEKGSPHWAYVTPDWRLHYNPDLIAGLDVREVAGTLYHEIWHLLLDYFPREGERDAVAYVRTPTGWQEVRLWNLAHDLAINSAIRLEIRNEIERYGLREHPLKLPDGAVYPEQFGLPDGKTAEWYYDELLRRIDKCKCGCHGKGKKGSRERAEGSGQGEQQEGDQEGQEPSASEPGQQEGEGGGEQPADESGGEQCCPCQGRSRGPDGLPRLDTDRPVQVDKLCPDHPARAREGDQRISGELRKYIKLKAAEYLRARGIGDMPGLFEQFVESMLGPRVDWRRVLRSEVRNALRRKYGHDRYSFARASRKQDVLPDLPPPAKLRQAPVVAVVADTSESMAGLVRDVAAEVEGIVRAAGEEVHYLSVDTEVHFAGRVKSAKQARYRGFGGTDMRVGIRAAAALRPRPNVIVVITDGDSPWEMIPPRTRVIACLMDGDRELPPWVRKVVVEDARRRRR